MIRNLLIKLLEWLIKAIPEQPTGVTKPSAPPAVEQRMSFKGIHHLTVSEGKRNKMYKDVGGKPTIGVGHLLTPEELETGVIVIAGEEVVWVHGLTDEQVHNLLMQDVVDHESAVREVVKVPLEQHQFDALVSFVYNVGAHAFRKSTLLKKLNLGLYESVPGQLARWNKVDGEVVRGLVNRRNREIDLWRSGLY